MSKEEMIKIWDTIPNKHKNYSGVEIVGEREMMKYFTRKELDIAEKKGWLYNNHAEYDMAEPSYNLIESVKK
jgi:hypothetical protein